MRLMRRSGRRWLWTASTVSYGLAVALAVAWWRYEIPIALALPPSLLLTGTGQLCATAAVIARFLMPIEESFCIGHGAGYKEGFDHALTISRNGGDVLSLRR